MKNPKLIPKTGTMGNACQVDKGRRSFLRNISLGLAGLAAAGTGCADAGESSFSGRSCSSSELPASCSHRAADSTRCPVWNDSPIELDGIFFYMDRMRREGTRMVAEIVPSIPELGCDSAISSPLPISIPGAGVMTIRGRGYKVTAYHAVINDGNPAQSWADVGVERFYTFCDYESVRQTLTVGEGTDILSSRDGKLSLRLMGVDTSGRAALKVFDVESRERGIIALTEGEVKFGRVGDKVYPITAHVVVAGNREMASCAEISISTCSELPHDTGVEFHW